MSKTTPAADLKQLAESLAKHIKTENDLGELTRLIRKSAIEAALGAEMEDHLGYAKHSPAGHHSGNSRNGYSSKTLKGDHGEVDSWGNTVCQKFNSSQQFYDTSKGCPVGAFQWVDEWGNQICKKF